MTTNDTLTDELCSLPAATHISCTDELCTSPSNLAVVAAPHPSLTFRSNRLHADSVYRDSSKFRNLSYSPVG